MFLSYRRVTALYAVIKKIAPAIDKYPYEDTIDTVENSEAKSASPHFSWNFACANLRIIILIKM